MDHESLSLSLAHRHTHHTQAMSGSYRNQTFSCIYHHYLNYCLYSANSTAAFRIVPFPQRNMLRFDLLLLRLAYHFLTLVLDDAACPANGHK